MISQIQSAANTGTAPTFTELAAKARVRVALLLDHPSPHMVNLLNALAQRNDIAAEVIYFRAGAPERNWGDPPGELPFQMASPTKGRPSLLNIPFVLRRLTSIRTDIVVVNSCYTTPETWAAIMQINRTSLPWVFMNEAVRMRGFTDVAKRTFLRRMLRGSVGVIGMGRDAQSQYCSLVSRKLPSISVPYLPDLSDFLAQPSVTMPTSVVRFFTAAQMIHRKAFDVLLAACSQLPHSGWELTIAGDGPLRPSLEIQFRSRFGNQVRFLGHIPYGKRARAFAEQQVFVFPSRWDGWGVAPVEAMAAGLPVISSDQVMSMREILQVGANGFFFRSENSVELAERMRLFISDPAKIHTMRPAARSSILNYSADNGAELLSDFLVDLMQGLRHSKCRTSQAISSDKEDKETWRSLTEPQGYTERLYKRSRATAKRAIINFSLALRPSFVPRGNRILVYHVVLKEDRVRFAEHLAFLKDHYQFATAQEIAGAKDSSSPTPLLAITFDDGFRLLMSDALEVLEQYGVKATFYIPTGFIALAPNSDRAADFSLRAHYYQRPLAPMNSADLKQLRQSGHEIGSHGVSHIGLNAVSRHVAKYELEESRDQLAQWLGETVTGFAYPYGFTKSVLGNASEWVADAGYEYAVTLKRGTVGKDSNLLDLPREHIEGNWPLRDLIYFLGR